MGELPGRLSEPSFGQERLLVSALVQYLNANDAGPGKANGGVRRG